MVRRGPLQLWHNIINYDGRDAPPVIKRNQVPQCVRKTRTHSNTSHEHNVRRFTKSHLDATERPRINARPLYMFELCVLRWISRKHVLPIRPNEKVMIVDARPLMVFAAPLAVRMWWRDRITFPDKRANSVGWHLATNSFHQHVRLI